MRHFGQTVQSVKEEVLVIPRTQIVSVEEDGKMIQKTQTTDFVFIARAVENYSGFESVLPMPTPPVIRRAGASNAEPDITNAEFVKKLNDWHTRRFEWMILETLKPSPGIEWETIKSDQPETWHLLETEMKAAGFNQVEVASVINLAARVNSLDEAAVEAGRQRFLASRAAPPAK